MWGCIQWSYTKNVPKGLLWLGLFTEECSMLKSVYQIRQQKKCFRPEKRVILEVLYLISTLFLVKNYN